MTDVSYSDDEYVYEYSDEEDMEYPEEEDRTSLYNKRLAPYSSSSPCSLEASGGYSSSRPKTEKGNFLGLDRSFPSDIQLLDSSEIFRNMKRRIHEVTDVLAIPPSSAGVLLREHKWLKESLYEKYYNNPEKIQEKCGVRARCNFKNGSQSKSSSKSAGKIHLCEICYDNYTTEEMLSMPCGHAFCLDCWRGFIDCTIQSGPACVRMTCPQVGCEEAVTEEEVALTAPDLLPKYEMYQLRSFVDMNGMTRWCPGPGCNMVAMAGNSGFNGIAMCNCGTNFCVRCGEEPHAPSSCDELRRWNEKCRNESETANWIIANTKPCPKCSSRIEKNQGCNHMTCQQCKYDFCWICGAPWSEHGSNTGGYYKCNKYDPNANGSDDQSNTAKAKRELDRYLHYYKRFHAHSEAQKFAKKQLKDTEARMVLLQESTDNSTWADVEFLKSAVDQLVECRRVLKYTYTYAYYMTDKARSKHKERFEHHQEMLEKFTEKLSELSEKSLAEMDRTDVVNQTRVVDRFMKNILKYVEDGMEEE